LSSTNWSEAALAAGGDLAPDVGRIFDNARGEHQGEYGDGDVDKEDPAPGEVVGDPAAQGGADHRRQHDRHAVDGEGLAALARRKRIDEDRLLAGLQAAAPGSLQDAKENQQRKRWGETAEHGTEAEERHADHVEALAPDKRHQISAGRKDDGVGNQIGRQHPGRFVR